MAVTALYGFPSGLALPPRQKRQKLLQGIPDTMNSFE